ncbi:hypothetical protein NM208_g11476 [Fusarium decemcellulare]|uniref:Uncharacterized protein n=1 Tax=Fusarium decemcellulare TaxID=57161 RepID=A0ACC1RT45_9HYPO|nr:hypothetical protein NM208_g11476 [Fusarium decemcellulare]
MNMKLVSMAIATLMAGSVTSLTIEHTALPAAGPGGSTGCIPTCTVYIQGARGCDGTAEFVGNCDERDGDTVRPANGCDGVDVRWIASGNGDGTLQVRDGNGWDEFRVDQCTPRVPTSIRCTFDGGCAATQV